MGGTDNLGLAELIGLIARSKKLAPMFREDLPAAMAQLPVLIANEVGGKMPRLWLPWEMETAVVDGQNNKTMWRNTKSNGNYTLPISTEGCVEFAMYIWCGSYFASGKTIDWQFRLSQSPDAADLDYDAGPDTDASPNTGRIAISTTMQDGGQQGFSTGNTGIGEQKLARLNIASLWSFKFAATDATDNIPVTAWVYGR